MTKIDTRSYKMYEPSRCLRSFFGFAFTNRILRTLFIGLAGLIYCEVLHYCVVLLQCQWPSLPEASSGGQIRVMFVADTHLLGFRNGHWFDKLRREWQMKQAFQTSMLIHKPDVVFVLGDLLDEGKWCGDDEFNYHVARFKAMFAVPYDTEMYIVSGNHDEGFHYMITHHKHLRFERSFDAPSVRQVRIKNNIFVLVNSMAMEGDACSLCSAAEVEIEKISEQLIKLQQCSKSTEDSMCNSVKDDIPYTQPILLQHFPMYRKSDVQCNTSDSAPPEVKTIPFREKYDCLDERSSKLLFSKVEPRLIISAHTHYGCYLVHPNGVPEWSVASFNWRNRNDPTFLLAQISNTDYVIDQCFMPKESTVMNMYMFTGVVMVISLLWPGHRLSYRQKIC